MDIYKQDASTLADQVRNGDLSAKEVLEATLERIERFNEELNAIIHLDVDAARDQAATVDAKVANGEDPGTFAGVPIGIKELENVKGWPATGGSVPHKDKIAERDSVHVERLRNAGAVIVGLTASPEFGSTAYTRTLLHGTTRNPWNLERTPGGSSGGSAAAVAAAILPIATASDGGGSIRIPASYSGLVGAKGTFGRVPKGGSADASHTTALGCVSRTVRDTARYWDIVVGPHERDPYSLPHPGLSYETTIDAPIPQLRVTWSDDLGYQKSSAEILRIVRDAADALAMEAKWTWTDRKVELKDMSVAWGLFNHPSTWLDVRDYWPDRADDFTPPIRAGVQDAERRFNLDEVARAYARRHENNVILAEVFDDTDVIITPTTGTTAFRAEGPMPTEIDGEKIKPMHSIYTYPFNVSGHPAVSVPCGVDADGLPVSLQLVGRRHSDHVLLQLAAALERARPWQQIAPAYE
jgi:aspartyl-tRNA(Asn)/glutamyl-tRNA(Gln) amidotransferase subunit A